MEIGSVVLYHEDGISLPALVINIFPTEQEPMLSVIVVETDEGRKGMYGREISFKTSLHHESMANSNPCWSRVLGAENACLNPVKAAEVYEGP